MNALCLKEDGFHSLPFVFAFGVPKFIISKIYVPRYMFTYTSVESWLFPETCKLSQNATSIFNISGLVSGENNKVSLSLSLCPCLINCPFLFPEPLGLHSSRLSDIPLGSLHPSSSRLSDDLRSLSFGSSQMWSAKLPCSRKKVEYEQTETQSAVVGKRKV